MRPLIICRSNKTQYLAHIAKSLEDQGEIEELFAYTAYYDHWRDYLQSFEGLPFKNIFGTKEIFESIDDRNVDPSELDRIEREYGHNLLWGLILTERWLVSTAAYPLFARVPYYTDAQKLQYFVKLIRQAETIFTENSIDCIIDFANMGLFRLALDTVAEKRGIPYYYVAHALLNDLETGDRFFIGTRINEDYGFLDTAYQRYRDNPELIKEGWDYLRKFREASSGSVYSHWNGASESDDNDILKTLMRTGKETVLAAGRMGKTVLRDIKWHTKAINSPEIRYNFALYKNDTLARAVRSVQKCLRSAYLRYACTFMKEPPDIKYAFITLHYQPELTTALWAPFEADQQTVIENIARALPLDYRLLVKLNKMMYGYDHIAFIRHMQKLPNVTLVDHCANTRAFLERAACVITITGTSGFEGALAGKKVIMLGDRRPPWNRIRSVTVVKKWRELHDEIAKAVHFKAADDDLAAYLQAVHDHSFALNKSYAWKSDFSVDDSDYTDAVRKVAERIAAIHKSRNAEMLSPKRAPAAA